MSVIRLACFSGSVTFLEDWEDHRCRVQFMIFITLYCLWSILLRALCTFVPRFLVARRPKSLCNVLAFVSTSWNWTVWPLPSALQWQKSWSRTIGLVTQNCWPALTLVALQNPVAPSRTPGLPYLFVGGNLLPENFTAESTQWLQQALQCLLTRLASKSNLVKVVRL